MESRNVLNEKAIDLLEQGKGKWKNKADPVTEEGEKLLWKKGVLGDANPVSLNHAVFLYTLSQHFGTREQQEHHQIKAEEVKFVSNVKQNTLNGLKDSQRHAREDWWKRKDKFPNKPINWWE